MKLLLLFLFVGVVWGMSVEEDDESLDKRILNGREAKRNEFPFMVSVQAWKGATCSPFCGGVILQSNWVLTAAHCFDDPKRLLYLTDLRLHAGSNVACTYESTSQVNFVEDVFLHPKYDAELIINDIALIKSKNPFYFTSNIVQPINLPTSEDETPNFGTLVGWGAINEDETKYPAQLMVAENMPISDSKECYKEFTDYNETSMICIGANHPKNACAGDSGGPFMQISKTTQKPIVVGVTSYGTNPCDTRPIVYTKVEHFLEFIKDTIKKHTRI